MVSHVLNLESKSDSTISLPAINISCLSLSLSLFSLSYFVFWVFNLNNQTPRQISDPAGYNKSSSNGAGYPDTTNSSVSSTVVTSTNKTTNPNPHKPSTLPQMNLTFPADFNQREAASSRSLSGYNNGSGVTIRMTTPSPPPPPPPSSSGGSAQSTPHQRPYPYHPKFHYNQRPRSPSPVNNFHH